MASLVRPHSRAYLLSLVLLVIAGLAGHRFYEARMAATTAGLERFTAPGATSVSLPFAGHFTIYVEHRSVLDGSLFLTGADLGALRCTVRGPDGSALELREAWLPLRYSLDRHAGRAALELWTAEPGVHSVEAAYPDGTAGPRVVLAVGEGMLGDLSTPIVAGLGFAAGAAITGLLAGFVVWRLRERSKKQVFGRYGR